MVLKAATISGRHAVIRVVRGAVTVTDLGSTNGTFVNGVKINPNSIVELRPGDELHLSRQVLFVLEAVATPR
jgi:pSer/pThr/pTyr-binding forkhead associated (FHA) protein